MFSPDFTQKTTAPTATIAVRPSAVAIFPIPFFFCVFTGSTASDLLYSALLRSAVFFLLLFFCYLFIFCCFPRFRSDRFYRFFTLGLTGSVFSSAPLSHHPALYLALQYFHPPVLLHSFRKILSHLTTLFHIPGIFSYLFSSPVPFYPQIFFFAINDPKSTSLFWIIYLFAV